MSNEWWRHAAVYQVYIRSFADGDGDGTGDITGLRNRLPYLSELGIDAIWLNPWYESPLNDGGYDVADYRKINHRFGTNAEASAFIDEAHEVDIKVIVDLVPNHTSDEHDWFKAALEAAPGHPARDRFIFRPGRGPDGSEPPNDWVATFGGSAWEQVPDGEWYLHLFDTSQPDLDWTNPEVLDEFDSIIRYWLDQGVDGFRVDVAHGLMKDPTFRDYRGEERAAAAMALGHPHWDRDEIHEVVRRWRTIVDSYDGDRMLLAEAWVRPERLPLYVRPDEYHLSFSFDFATARWTPVEFTKVITDSLTEAASVGAPATWVLSNHDIVRHATRFGLPTQITPPEWLLDGPHDLLDVNLGLRRARAGSLMMLALPGTAYIYQGEELGLPEVWDLDEAVLDDPIWALSEHTRKGRDGCRVPLP
ncbi:MAG: alpha-glucosidase, partial [Actinobacteria bacterium]|nr:alpha-glucosidase [Actinomycetota bacterium]